MRALNAKGIVHRDMKPQNILLCFPPGAKNPPASQINLKIGKDPLLRLLDIKTALLLRPPIFSPKHNLIEYSSRY